MSTTEHPKIALIDADFLAYSVGFTCEDDDDPQIAKNRLTEWLTDIVYINLQCDDYVAYTTGKGNFRYDIAKTIPYKGNRKDMKRPKHLDALKEHLRRLGAVEVEGIEADDAVAIKNAQEPDKYFLAHVDKDLNQLQGWHYNPNKDIKYYVSEEEGNINFYTQMLTGDRVDAIPGLKGIGPKKAEKILKGLTTEKDLEQQTWKTYQEHGHTFDYFVEQGRLLFLLREENQIWTPKHVSCPM